VNTVKFNEVIDFAIKMEKDAVKFYLDLKSLVSLKEAKELLLALEEMEKVHIDILENFRTCYKKKNEFFKPKFVDISESEIEIKISDEVNIQDILAAAINREEKAYKLYMNLSNQSTGEDAKKLFLRLANEEARHKLLLEEIYEEEKKD
jgi:rubrerythrin